MKDTLYQKRTKYSWPKRGPENVEDFPSHISDVLSINECKKPGFPEETNAKVTVCQNLHF